MTHKQQATKENADLLRYFLASRIETAIKNHPEVSIAASVGQIGGYDVRDRFGGEYAVRLTVEPITE